MELFDFIIFTGEDGRLLEYGIHMPEVKYQSFIATGNDGFGLELLKSNKNATTKYMKI